MQFKVKSVRVEKSFQIYQSVCLGYWYKGAKRGRRAVVFDKRKLGKINSYKKQSFSNPMEHWDRNVTA